MLSHLQVSITQPKFSRCAIHFHFHFEFQNVHLATLERIVSKTVLTIVTTILQFVTERRGNVRVDVSQAGRVYNVTRVNNYCSLHSEDSAKNQAQSSLT